MMIVQEECDNWVQEESDDWVHVKSQKSLRLHSHTGTTLKSKLADFENMQNDGYGFATGSNNNKNDSDNSSDSDNKNDKENDNKSRDGIRGFLEQFAALKVRAANHRGIFIDISADPTNEIETPCNTTPKSVYNLLLPSGIAKFFAGLDDDQDSDDEDKSKIVRHFQKLIATVISG